MTSTPSSKPSTDPDIDIGPLRTLLATAVDHAGLFPPAGLNMSSAVAAFHGYRSGGHAWMLGSFVVPAGRLEELADAVVELTSAADRTRVETSEPHDPWPVSVIVASPEEGAEAMELVWGRLAHALRVAAFEVRPVESETIREKHAHLRGQAFEGVHVYYETPLDERLGARLDAIAAVGAAAKVRAGGVTAGAFPTREDLVDFMLACAERDLAFKATAGLHHAFAGSYPLTYEVGSASGAMHGFLGVVLTAALVRLRSVDQAEAVRSLAGGAGNLEVLDDTLVWLGHPLSHTEIADVRRDFFRSFGSCSFEEPVAELREAGLVDATSAGGRHEHAR
jgi:hypothetical protein